MSNAKRISEARRTARFIDGLAAWMQMHRMLSTEQVEQLRAQHTHKAWAQLREILDQALGEPIE